MSGYASNSTYDELVGCMQSARGIALTTHRKPDGDAMGSVLALARVLATFGKTATIYLVGPVDAGMRALAGDTPFVVVPESEPLDDHDLIIVVDTGSWSQLEPIGSWLRRHAAIVIGFDHHAHGDDVAGRRIVDTSAASTTQVLLPLVDRLGVELTGEIGGIAEALFIGLATDTGWFRYSNADAAAFAAASRLLATGVDKSRLYQLIEETHRPQRLSLFARALGSLRYLRGGDVAILSLTESDFRETGGSVEDLESLVNMPMAVGKVRVSVLLTEPHAGLTKLSFRSKPAVNGRADTLGDLLDVNRVAQRFGGGGHYHAAGARVEKELGKVLEELSGVFES